MSNQRDVQAVKRVGRIAIKSIFLCRDIVDRVSFKVNRELSTVLVRVYGLCEEVDPQWVGKYGNRTDIQSRFWERLDSGVDVVSIRSSVRSSPSRDDLRSCRSIARSCSSRVDYAASDRISYLCDGVVGACSGSGTAATRQSEPSARSAPAAVPTQCSTVYSSRLRPHTRPANSAPPVVGSASPAPRSPARPDTPPSEPSTPIDVAAQPEAAHSGAECAGEERKPSRWSRRSFMRWSSGRWSRKSEGDSHVNESVYDDANESHAVSAFAPASGLGNDDMLQPSFDEQLPEACHRALAVHEPVCPASPPDLSPPILSPDALLPTDVSSPALSRSEDPPPATTSACAPTFASDSVAYPVENALESSARSSLPVNALVPFRGTSHGTPISAPTYTHDNDATEETSDAHVVHRDSHLHVKLHGSHAAAPGQAASAPNSPELPHRTPPLSAIEDALNGDTSDELGLELSLQRPRSTGSVDCDELDIAASCRRVSRMLKLCAVFKHTHEKPVEN